MLHVILMLGKIIGILIAVVLTIVLVLIGIVLFVPIHGEILGNFPGTREEMTIKAEFSWLFHLFVGEASYEQEKFHWKMRAAWVRFDKKKKEKKVSTTSRSKPEKKPPEVKTTGEKKNLKEIWKSKTKLVDFFQEDVHKQAFAKLKRESKWMARFLKTERFHFYLYYGFEDPCTTGQVLAILSIIYPFVGDNMKVTPDFEQKIFQGDFFIKGKGLLFFPVLYVVKLILDSSVRSAFMDFKNFE